MCVCVCVVVLLFVKDIFLAFVRLTDTKLAILKQHLAEEPLARLGGPLGELDVPSAGRKGTDCF